MKDFRVATPRTAYLLLESIGPRESRDRRSGADPEPKPHSRVADGEASEEVSSRQFDRRAAPMFDLAFALRDRNEALVATRDLLLPRLVTGRLDIADVDLGDLLSAEAA